MKRQQPTFSEVNLSEHDGVRYLHLGTEWVQGSMRIDAPFEIDLEYVQRMMAWLLFVPEDSVAGRHAMQLGLGAGAITKFCYKKLRMTCTAVELNPAVIAVGYLMGRKADQWQKLPVAAFAAAFAGFILVWIAVWLKLLPAKGIGSEGVGTVDALAVDLYDDEAAAPVLDSAAFYADCRRLLTEDGCMTVNLFGRSSSFERSLACISEAFGAQAVWAFKATREGNTVVLAQRSATRPKRPLLQQRAEEIEARWGLPARKWLKAFKAIEK